MDQTRGAGMERLALALAVLLLAAGCLLRLVRLDADPHYYGWWGHLYDEGRWVQQARSLALRGVLIENVPSPNLLVAPGFEAASYAAFSLLGVSRVSARLFPALCGCALLLLLYAHFRSRASPSGLALGLGLIALQADAVVLSRVAVPEMPAMLATLIAFVALTAREPTALRLGLAGALTALAVGVKSTALPVVGVFAVLAFGLRERASARERWRDLGAFALGLAALAALPALVGVWILAPELGNRVDLGHRVALLAELLELRDPYSLIALPLRANVAPVLNSAGLALLAAALAAIGGPASDPTQRRAMRGAVLWAVLYVGVIGLQGYFPERYILHLLLPLAVLSALAATRLEALGASGVAHGIGGLTGPRRALGVGVLCAPGAALLAPATAALLGILGAPVERLFVEVVALLGTWLALSAAVAPVAQRPRTVSFWMGLPLIGGAAWFAAWAVAERSPPFWIREELVQGAALWVVFLGLASAATLLALRLIRTPARRVCTALALASVWSAAWAAQLAPGFLEPRYSVRDSSRALGEGLADAGTVLQDRAEGLFLDNELRYRWIWSPFVPDSRKTHWTRTPHEYLVAELPFRGDAQYLTREYELLRSFLLHAPSTRWPAPRTSTACSGARGQCVALFRKITP